MFQLNVPAVACRYRKVYSNHDLTVVCVFKLQLHYFIIIHVGFWKVNEPGLLIDHLTNRWWGWRTLVHNRTYVHPGLNVLLETLVNKLCIANVPKYIKWLHLLVMLLIVHDNNSSCVINWRRVTGFFTFLFFLRKLQYKRNYWFDSELSKIK